MTSKGALERALDILFLLGTEPPGLEVEVMARRLGIPASSAYRILRALRRRGLVAEANGGRRYRLGLTFLHLATVVEQDLDVVRLADPALQRLAAETAETVLLTVLDGMRAVTADVRVTAQPVRVSASRGRVVPLHAGAAAKAILASLPEDRWGEAVGAGPLRALTRRTFTSSRRLREECRRIRSLGYATSDEEILEGTRAVAAPVLDKRGAVCASLAVVGPLHRLRGPALQRATALVKREAGWLSGALGHGGALRRPAGRGGPAPMPAEP